MVSGRGLADLDRVLEGRVPAVARRARPGAPHARTARSSPAAPPTRGSPSAARGLRAFAARDSRLLVEDKGAAVALHYRRAPTRAGVPGSPRLGAANWAWTSSQATWSSNCARPGPDKGEAVRAFMAEPPFAGFTPVYLGDDLTDEDGFRARAQALGGFGVIVGGRRPTAARFALADVGGGARLAGRAPCRSRLVTRRPRSRADRQRLDQRPGRPARALRLVLRARGWTAIRCSPACWPAGDPADAGEGFWSDRCRRRRSRRRQAYLRNTPVLRTEITDAGGGAAWRSSTSRRDSGSIGRGYRPTAFIRLLRPLAGAPRVTIRLRPTADWGARRAADTSGSNHIRYAARTSPCG